MRYVNEGYRVHYKLLTRTGNLIDNMFPISGNAGFKLLSEAIGRAEDFSLDVPKAIYIEVKDANGVVHHEVSKSFSDKGE